MVRRNRTRCHWIRWRRGRTDRWRLITEVQVVDIEIGERRRVTNRAGLRVKLHLENISIRHCAEGRKVNIETVPLPTNNVQNKTLLAVTDQEDLHRA